MHSDYGNKVIKTKKLDKDTTLKVIKNELSGRIFVEFSGMSGKLVLQRNFQDSLIGIRESEKFQKIIKNTKDLKKYFGLSK